MSTAKSSIEWTNRTWNPVRGCELESPGCANCYAMKTAHRFAGKGQPYEGLTRLRKHHGPVWTGEVREIPAALIEPLTWRAPQRIFVNSMSDLFHEDVSDEFIAAVFGIMAACPQHTFQVLTKRAARMRSWFEAIGKHPLFRTDRGIPSVGAMADEAAVAGNIRNSKTAMKLNGPSVKPPPWPLPNVHLGVSVENQPYAEERVPYLVTTPAAVRFLSVEPMLGPVDLTALATDETCEHCGEVVTCNAFSRAAHCSCCVEGDEPIVWGSLSWVIVGAESGHSARPMNEDWVRALRDQCTAQEVAFFYKQRAEKGRKITLPMLDGRQHMEFPR